MNRLLVSFAALLTGLSPLVVDSTLKGAALLTLALVSASALNTSSAATRHLVWLVAVLALLIVPVLSVALPEWRILPRWTAASPSPTTEPLAPEPVTIAAGLPGATTTVPAAATEVDRPSATVATPPPVIAPVPVHPPIAAPTRPSFEWLALAWAAGFALLLLRLLAAQFLLRSRARKSSTLTTDDPITAAFASAGAELGVRRRVTLLLDGRRTIPVVWGVLRPHLLLPLEARDWSDEQLRSVLLHELAHVKRCDPLVQWMSQLACALHWWNPLVWFAAWRLSVERERACDDLVLASGVRPSAYAEHLLHVATRLAPARWTSACGLAMARRSSLEGRLHAVLSEELRRHRVSAPIAAVALVLGAGLAVPVAMLRAVDEEPPAATAPELRPQHEDAQSLFEIWRAHARTDGKIPGALIARLAREVRYFISLNQDDSGEGRDLAVKFKALLPRFDAPDDWTQSDAIALLDDVAAIHGIPLMNALAAAAERVFLAGEPLPAELTGAAWGQASPDGLRVAWLLEPRRDEHPLGTSLRSRILVHNSGRETVLFIMPSWQQSGEHTAHDAKGAAIDVSSTMWTTLARKLTYRLAPGQYCESPAPGIGVGARTDDEDWANVRVGAWIDAQAGDEVRFTPDAVEVRFSPSEVGTRFVDGRPTNVDPKDAADLWRTIIAERIELESPLPAAAAERVEIIRRVTLDLFGDAPAPEEIAAFVADDAATAQAALEKRLLERPGVKPFTGTLPPGDLRFRVLAADPDAAKRPRAATGPGYYVLGDHQRLQVEQSRSDGGPTNRATILFFSAGQKTAPPAEPFEIALPDGRLTYAIAWDRGTAKLWITEKGLVRTYDFSDPAHVKETRLGPDSFAGVPDRIRDAFRAALDVPGAPVQQERLRRKDGP